MLALIPVYTDLNGIHDVTIFRENEDGSFSKTPGQPLRQLRENFVGVTNPIGTLITQRYDRSERAWNTPTALPYSGRPRSFYTFVRENLEKRRIIVATTQSSQGKSVRLFLNVLKLSPSVGQGTLKLIITKYLEAINLWEEADRLAQAATGPESLPGEPSEVTEEEVPETSAQTPVPAPTADSEADTAEQTPETNEPAPEAPPPLPVHTPPMQASQAQDAQTPQERCKDRMSEMSAADIAKLKRLRKTFQS